MCYSYGSCFCVICHVFSVPTIPNTDTDTRMEWNTNTDTDTSMSSHYDTGTDIKISIPIQIPEEY